LLQDLACGCGCRSGGRSRKLGKPSSSGFIVLLLAGVERTWWRLCHLSLGSNWSEIWKVSWCCALSWSCWRCPRHASKKRKKNKFLSHVKWDCLNSIFGIIFQSKEKILI
jgi:hypothetical protein